MGVLIREYLPIAALRPFVRQYWEGIFMGKPEAVLEQKIIPTGFIELVLHLSEARCELKINSSWQESDAFSMIGFWTAPYLLQFRDKVETFGIRLTPEAMYFIFGIPATEFINNPANLSEIFGPSFTSFCLQLEALKTIEERIQLADSYLLKRLYQTPHRSYYIQMAAELIRQQKGELSVEHLSNKVCISTRQLEREFKNKIGISPKTYMRITRLNKILQLIKQNSSISMAQLSYLGGYSDQAHFIKEFKQLAGELPSMYISDQKNSLIY